MIYRSIIRSIEWLVLAPVFLRAHLLKGTMDKSKHRVTFDVLILSNYTARGLEHWARANKLTLSTLCLKKTRVQPTLRKTS